MGLSKLVPYHSAAGSKSHSMLRDLAHHHRDHPLELLIDIESPPCVLYGSATESSGALLSGLLTLSVKDPYESEPNSGSITPVNSRDGKRKNGLSSLSSTLSHLSLSSAQVSPVQSSTNLKIMSGYTKVTITSVTLTFVQKVQYHKPFLPDGHSFHSCMNCKTKTTDMKTWVIQDAVQDMAVGRHSFPFSYLVPGSVPAKSFLGLNSATQIKYELIAVVTYKDPKRGSSSKQQLIQLSMPVSVTRSIPRGPDKNSLRVFPPTELTATAVLPNVVYPKSTFPLEMKINGVSSEDRRWRMRKLAWRIEEVSRIRCNTCEIHKHELKQLEETVKEKEASKKSSAIKKYNGESGPQVRLTVGAEISPLQAMRRGSSLEATPSNTQASPGDQDEEDAPNDFVHPSDDALRQEIQRQQQRLREQQVEETKKNDIQVYTEEIRTVVRGEMKSGWKTDFDNNGQIELITDIDCTPVNSGVANPITHVSTASPHVEPLKQDTNISCDIQDPTLGVFVNHILAVEIVVAEETLQHANGQPVRKSSASGPSLKPNVSDPDQRLAELSPMFASRNNARSRPVEADTLTPTQSSSSTKSNGSSKGTAGNSRSRIVSVPTGAARVLRMQFRVLVTERSGLGISWDEEVPPIYQDIKLLSPPSYEKSIKKSATAPSLGAFDQSGFQRENRSDMLLQSISPPPVAHHHNSSTSLRALTTVQSPNLDSVVSIQGNVPFQDHALTPHATRDISIRNISELIDTDRITQ